MNTPEHPFSEETEKLYMQASNGNAEALQFLCMFNKYCHGIDDIVDGEVKDAEGIISIFLSAGTVFSHSYWQVNGRDLYMTLVLLTNDYADSTKPTEVMKDLLRFSGNNMIKAVAFLCGGYGNLRNISTKLNDLAFKEHHNSDNQPI